MRVEVMHHYGLVHPLNRAGYYETTTTDVSCRTSGKPSPTAA